MPLTSLPHDVLSLVLQDVCQRDVANLAATCRHLHQPAVERLYRRLLITDKKYPADPTWSYVANSIHGVSPLRRLEQTFRNHSSLMCLVEEIVVEDVVFMLFKLSTWQTMLEPHATHLRLRSLYFGGVPMSHFNTAYDDLLAFYKSPVGQTLRQIQVRSLGDLEVLAKGLNNVSEIMFTIVDVADLHATYSSSVEHLLRGVTRLVVVSSHHLSLRLLKSIGDVYGQILHLEHLELNHCHGTSQGSLYSGLDTRLDVTAITGAINLQNTLSLCLEIGCAHLRVPTVSEVATFDPALLDSCPCLGEFLEKLDVSPKHLTLKRLGQQASSNPHAVISFKDDVCHFLSKASPLHLVLDSGCTVLRRPEYHQKFASTNRKLLYVIGKLHLRLLHIEDYAESFLIGRDMLYTPHESIRRRIDSFIDTNSRIQFYLNPLVTKSVADYKRDVVESVLQILHNPHFVDSFPRGTSSMGPVEDETKKPKGSFSSQVLSLPRGVSGGLPQVNLHDLFRHDTYKELVNYNMMRDLLNRRWIVKGSGLSTTASVEMANSMDIQCGCCGREFAMFKAILRNNLRPPVKCNRVMLNHMVVNPCQTKQ